MSGDPKRDNPVVLPRATRAPSKERRVGLPKIRQDGERRRRQRYRLELEARYKVLRRGEVLASGVGRTVDISSQGILFSSDQPLAQGLNVELSISWPTLLNQVAPLQLLVVGRVVRCGTHEAAIQFERYTFRTRRLSQLSLVRFPRRSPEPPRTIKPAAPRQSPLQSRTVSPAQDAFFQMLKAQ
jgi:hypothetical protein